MLRAHHGGQQRGSLWALVPGEAAGVADVEELRDDAATPGGQLAGRVHLPGPRRRGVLVLAGGHPTVERQPQSSDNTWSPTAGELLAGRSDAQPPEQRAGVLNARGTTRVDHLAVVAHLVQRQPGLPRDELIGLSPSLIVARGSALNLVCPAQRFVEDAAEPTMAAGVAASTPTVRVILR